jgi:hypothetical protein
VGPNLSLQRAWSRLVLAPSQESNAAANRAQKRGQYAPKQLVNLKDR